MTEAQVVKLIAVLSANYRNWPEEGKEDVTAALWTNMLEDIPFDVGQAAARAHMSRSVFPPTIADIRDASARIMKPPQMDAIEAWGIVLDAIHRYGMYRQDEAMQALPADVRDMVKRFTWRELCLSEQPDVIRAQWRMAWESHVKQVREYGVMPADVRELIESSGVIKRIGGNHRDEGRGA